MRSNDSRLEVWEQNAAVISEEAREAAEAARIAAEAATQQVPYLAGFDYGSV